MDPLDLLPNEVIFLIFGQLSRTDLATAQLVSSTWQNLTLSCPTLLDEVTVKPAEQSYQRFVSFTRKAGTRHINSLKLQMKTLDPLIELLEQPIVIDRLFVTFKDLPRATPDVSRIRATVHHLNIRTPSDELGYHLVETLMPFKKTETISLTVRSISKFARLKSRPIHNIPLELDTQSLFFSARGTRREGPLDMGIVEAKGAHTGIVSCCEFPLIRQLVIHYSPLLTYDLPPFIESRSLQDLSLIYTDEGSTLEDLLTELDRSHIHLQGLNYALEEESGEPASLIERHRCLAGATVAKHK